MSLDDLLAVIHDRGSARLGSAWAAVCITTEFLTSRLATSRKRLPKEEGTKTSAKSFNGLCAH